MVVLIILGYSFTLYDIIHVFIVKGLTKPLSRNQQFMLVEILSVFFWGLYVGIIKFQYDINVMEKALVYRKAEMNVEHKTIKIWE